MTVGQIERAYAASAVTKTYRAKTGDVIASDRIDLVVQRAEVFGLLGPNGAGKTSLVRQLIGLMRPDAGRIELFGHDVIAQPRVVPDFVAYLPQDDAALSDLTPARALETTARLRGLSRQEAAKARDDVIDELGLSPYADRPIGKLSGGQRRLACVGAALVGERPVLVLDEPTTGLDPVARRAVWAAVERRRAKDATVLLVTHNVLEAETVLDRVAILDHGKVIACDTPGRLKAMVDRDVRLELAWRHDPPDADPLVASLRGRAVEHGRRWSIRLPAAEARDALAQLTNGPLFAALDDFTLSTPSLEDVYLALGGAARDLERA
ncbi:MAG: type transport system ATP-binding protein [Actinomycetota bacterium]|jgi:ABC-2 type transport system ATP-binding protein|nr:type transport system ATP-binding protein [Actinomycetota bacterium]